MATERRKPTAEEARAILTQLSQLSHEQKADLAARAKPLVSKRESGRQQQDRAPQTDDELHEWIKENTGIDIPRVAVCDDHNAPFDVVADAYFNREDNLFEVGSRESGKTLKASILHFVNSETKDGIEGLTFGAIEPQARRAYKHLKSFLYLEEMVKGEVKRTLRGTISGEPMRSETHWKNGSQVEIVVGSKSGVNSPHPQVVHADEVDLMDEEVWDESRSMSSSKQRRDGTWIKAQDYATSTRKTMNGLVQKLWTEATEAVANGLKPPWKFYISCVFENAAEVPECRRADPEARRKRLEELGLDSCLLCECHQTVRGEWDKNTPRSLESVCGGKFFRSRGWMLHSDVKRKFRSLTQAMWEAQMECSRPMVDGLYLPAWSRSRYVTNNWIPRPEYGPVYIGVDWGGSALSFVLWSQFLLLPVTICKRDGTEVEIPRFSYVVFDELYDAEAGATKLADMVVAREVAWRRQVPGFFVQRRYADMAGKQARNDWKQHTPSLVTSWDLPSREFDPTVRCMQGLVEEQRYWVDERCSRHIDDIESWRQKNGRELHDNATHSAAAARYMMANCEVRQKRRQKAATSTGDSIMPVIVQRQPSRDGGVAIAGQSNSFADEERWRGKLGGPIPMGWH